MSDVPKGQPSGRIPSRAQTLPRSSPPERRSFRGFRSAQLILRTRWSRLQAIRAKAGEEHHVPPSTVAAIVLTKEAFS
jgi:hypothetical protein